jgi:hypothetical protein
MNQPAHPFHASPAQTAPSAREVAVALNAVAEGDVGGSPFPEGLAEVAEDLHEAGKSHGHAFVEAVAHVAEVVGEEGIPFLSGAGKALGALVPGLAIAEGILEWKEVRGRRQDAALLGEFTAYANDAHKGNGNFHRDLLRLKANPKNDEKLIQLLLTEPDERTFPLDASVLRQCAYLQALAEPMTARRRPDQEDRARAGLKALIKTVSNEDFDQLRTICLVVWTRNTDGIALANNGVTTDERASVRFLNATGAEKKDPFNLAQAIPDSLLKALLDNNLAKRKRVVDPVASVGRNQATTQYRIDKTTFATLARITLGETPRGKQPPAFKPPMGYLQERPDPRHLVDPNLAPADQVDRLRRLGVPFRAAALALAAAGHKPAYRLAMRMDNEGAPWPYPAPAQAKIDVEVARIEADPQFQEPDGVAWANRELADTLRDSYDNTVRGDLNLSGVPWLKALPAGLRIQGSLDVSDCRGLEAIPEGVGIGGSLFAAGCVNLQTLPQGLALDNGALDLSRCETLTALPEGLRTLDWINLGGCTALKVLPKGLQAGTNLVADGCIALETIADGLRVGQNLILDDCPRLGALPNDLRVRGTLSLWRNIGLRALPSGLEVLGGLHLTGCANLASLPPDLRQGDSANPKKALWLDQDCPLAKLNEGALRAMAPGVTTFNRWVPQRRA